MENEKRLIKPETIKLELAFIGCEPKHLAAVDRCATVNAVEVVWCKDCKKSYNGMSGLMCGRCSRNINGIRVGGTSVKEEHFCSYGEREGE